MARKFKVGDKVKVVKQWGSSHIFLNKTGKIVDVEIYMTDLWPYRVKFRKYAANFNARELEKIN